MKIKAKLNTLFIALIIGGLTLHSCEKGNNTVNQSPNCKIISPSDVQEISKGETVTISVEASDTDGNIAEVLFFIDNVEIGSVSSLPFTYQWTTTSETIGSHTLKATSLDNNGATTTDEIAIKIIEDGGNYNPPTAMFVVVPSIGIPSTYFVFDASGSLDNNDSTSNVKVRWDFDGNGTWDINWTPNKKESHQFNSQAIFTTILEVKDSKGLISQYSRSITVNTTGGSTGILTDQRDGQNYNTIVIGDQIWMAQNLNYKSSNSYVQYDISSNGDIYGRLYNWEDALALCPNGWHLSSEDEWRQLEMYLGMSPQEVELREWRGTDEGGKMKETDTIHWKSPNIGATNSSGFAALPGGNRNTVGSYYGHGTHGGWWTSTQIEHNQVHSRWLLYLDNRVRHVESGKDSFQSVRCIKD